MEIDARFLASLKCESHLSPKAVRRKTRGKGQALFAKGRFRKGEIVSISGGVILPEAAWAPLREVYGDYSFHVEEGFVICPLNPANPSDDWRMNHCCKPNCGLKGQIVFVALRDIEPGEELTFDYATAERDPSYQLEIPEGVCGKEGCRRRVTGNDWKERACATQERAPARRGARRPAAGRRTGSRG